MLEQSNYRGEMHARVILTGIYNSVKILYFSSFTGVFYSSLIKLGLSRIPLMYLRLVFAFVVLFLLSLHFNSKSNFTKGKKTYSYKY